ncbi:MAG: D-alanine--D-alanine ligase [Proteobacteria bacterium]|nr:D-alanine--D-alanine ligase [Pseudomonadota bacterium]MBU1741672.1 D-alanine--D-alanine ligase [Pseudomonadota bacterium]
MAKLKVAVLSGGRSQEREISLQSGRNVLAALDRGKYEVVSLDPATDLGTLVELAPGLDVALIMLHGRWGEDGTVQGLLDLLDVPYQCAGAAGCVVSMDKVISKALFRAAGLPVIEDMVVRAGQEVDSAAVFGELGPQVVVKPAREGSSLGMSMPRSEAELETALEIALASDSTVLIERRVIGRELTVAVIGNHDPVALPVVEITPGDGYEYFDYRAKYISGATHEVCPAPIPDELTRRVQELGLAAHLALNLTGYSRTDLILDSGRGDTPYLLETNTIPGMTETSLLPQAAAVAGMDMAALLDRLIELALARKK